MNAILIGIVAAILAVSLNAQQTLSQKSSRESFGKAVLLEAKDFNEVALVAVARTFLGEHTEKQLAKLLIVTNKDRGWMVKYGAPARPYLSYYLEQRAPEWQSEGMAELLRVGSDAVLRIRYPDKKLGRIVLQGRDPLKWSMRGIDVEILYVDFPSDGPPPPGSFLMVFVRTSVEPTSEICRSVTTAIQQRFSTPRGAVCIRSDPWFIGSGGVPVEYRFWESRKFPGPVEFIETPRWLSGWGGPDERCLELYPTRAPKYCADAVQ